MKIKENWTYKEREIVFKALVGSHNYNLADETSDRDYKVFLVPTVQDLIRGIVLSKSEKNATVIIHGAERKNCDVEYKDIRTLLILLRKSNINYTEILFTTEIDINPKYKEFVYNLLSHKEEFAKINMRYWFNSCRGISYNCNKRILSENRTANTELVEKFGYDTKEAMKSIRALDFLIRFQICENFQNSFSYDTRGREKLLAIKHGHYTLEQYYELRAGLEKSVEKLADWYEQKEFSETSNALLEKIITDICLFSIKNCT